MAADYRKARKTAARLLDKYGIVRPPINPQAIAEAEGIDVVFVEFKELSKRISGFFDFEENRIYVNKSIPGNRMTFTIAHELAHALMHRAYAESAEYRAMPRSNLYRDKPDVEREADVFAACLLVPADILKSYRKHASTSELARVFAVAEDVVLIQNMYTGRHGSI